MSLQLPVICDNSECGKVWFAVSPFGFAADAFLTGNKLYPCPSCGDLGSIPDGIYSDVSITFFDQSQFAATDDALHSLYRHIKDGGAPSSIAAEISQNNLLQFLKGGQDQGSDPVYCFRGTKSGQKPIFRNFGRPRGLLVISIPRNFAVSANHKSSPNGQPRSRLR
jgi:hypothetical protein